MEAIAELSPQQRERLRAMLADIVAADGISPLNESGELIADGQRPGTLLLAEHGFALLDPREHTAMLGVLAAHRRRGLGSALLAEVLRRDPGVAVWAFDTRPGSTELCGSHGLTPQRELLKMARPLDPALVPATAPGYSITRYEPSDTESVVEINRVAFAHHPEQGLLTLEEFHQLSGQPWFSAPGLLVARREGPDAEAAGFHWTKRHGDGIGEVYVLAVRPDHGGSGLGRALLEAGLAHLAAQGDHTVELYVEAAQSRVVELYRRAGFEVVRTDTSFATKEAP